MLMYSHGEKTVEKVGQREFESIAPGERNVDAKNIHAG